MSERTDLAGANPPADNLKVRVRTISAVLLALVLVAYLIAVTVGWIPAGQKLGTADLMLVVVVLATMIVLLNPRILERIESVKFGRLEFQLSELRKDVDDIRFILRMLVTEPEKRHLEMLDEGDTSNYSFEGGLEQELRRLRALGCIKSKDGHRLADMPRAGSFDLADFVTLTDLGRDYLSRLKQIGL
jgi:hypothetical protein